jgi:Flp pilus assembly protein TadG
MRTLRRLGERGQDAVEFALIISVLLLVLMGIFDMGRVAYSYSVLLNAAREGARYGVIHPTDTAGIKATVLNMAVGLDPSALTVTTTAPDSSTIQVSLSYQFTFVTPVIQAFFGSGPLTLVGDSRMRLEQ